jgi:polysaccharide biosynthesis protein PslG
VVTLPRVAPLAHGRRALVAAVLLLIVGIALAEPSPSSAAATTSATCSPHATKGRGFVGVTAQDILLGNSTFRQCSLNALARAHVGVLREVFYWAGIETAPGEYQFGPQDDYVADAARRKMSVLPVLLWAPDFRSTAPGSGRRHGFYPPRNPSEMGAFAAVLAKRYGPNGSFWQANPQLPYYPITSWQIWNEPNLPVYWADGPNPAAYAALLRGAADGLHSVDPQAEIVTAGLPYSADRRTMSPEKFLKGMYAAGGRGAFTTLAVHPYSDTVKRMVVALARMRRVMVRNGDAGVPIWVTEVGWATSGPRSVFTVNRKRQAQLIAQTARVLSHQRRRLRLRGFVIYNVRDSKPTAGDHDFWAFHAGLFDLEGRAKPAVKSLRSAARHL